MRGRRKKSPSFSGGVDEGLERLKRSPKKALIRCVDIGVPRDIGEIKLPGPFREGRVTGAPGTEPGICIVNAAGAPIKNDGGTSSSSSYSSRDAADRAVRDAVEFLGEAM